jgi:hypothetical protein
MHMVERAKATGQITSLVKLDQKDRGILLTLIAEAKTSEKQHIATYFLS